ncbi:MULTISPECIES: MaoC family dehydratase [Tepidiphilus]|uniref:MaoC family dehydratase n=1 Tax=Tepidiphilus TaxID=203470 RepID=UPI00115F4C79|nr:MULTISPECIES: MaoC family dehydratase [Tepidiphilus]
MAKEYKYYWEDFVPGSVQEVGGVEVTKEAIIEFARQYDPQPFHVDEEAARQSPYGGLIASGWHTCALAMRMICDAFMLEAASVGSPGIDNLRWLKPVRPGDVLRVRLTVLEARPLASKPGIGLVRHRWEVLNQNDEVVMEMEGAVMFRRRQMAS